MTLDCSPSTKPAKILVVDDTPANVRLLAEILLSEGYQVLEAYNGETVLVMLEEYQPDLILLDIMMPGLSGFDVCERLKQNPQSAQIPIIFISALHEVFDKVKAFNAGGADYITKPFEIPEVLTRIEHQLALYEARQQIQQLNAELESRVEERTQQLQQAVVRLETEIEERQRIQDQLKAMTLQDALTGLPNRNQLMQRLQEVLNQRKPRVDAELETFAVLFLDCDRFKVVNDSLGHLVGDELLVHLSRRLTQTVPAPNLVARLGGDEFAVLLTDLSMPELADPSIKKLVESQPNSEDYGEAISPDCVGRVTQIADAIIQQFAQPFHIQGHEIFINASIGITFSHPHYHKPEQLLRDADMAMYRAKARGRARYHVFDAAMYDEAMERLLLETDLRKAIEQDELFLYYQPILSLETQKVIGFEALLRWRHPSRGLISPATFIPLAEETGLIAPIGYWVLRTACMQMRQWQAQHIIDDSVSISVNLSIRQLADPAFLRQLDGVLADTDFSPNLLKLEVTESILANQHQVIQLLQQLHERQIQLSLDDFGTGFSSLSYLNTLPFDILKIDKSFVQPVSSDSQSLGLIPAILAIAQTFNMQVIAEGVETLEQAEHLKQLNCPLGQGYFFAKPLPAEEIETYLQQQGG
ncbi:MAG: two-component system response regulator [Thainema sp.]